MSENNRKRVSITFIKEVDNPSSRFLEGSTKSNSTN